MADPPPRGPQAMSEIEKPKLTVDPTISDGARKRFAEYLNEGTDDLDSIAFAGPSNASSEDNIPFAILAGLLLLEREPENGFHYLNLANIYVNANQPYRALEVIQALKKIPYNFYGYYDDPDFRIGILEADNGNYSTALQSLLRCLNRFPTQKQYIAYYIGTVFHEKCEYRKAMNWYLSAKRRFFLRGRNETSNRLKIAECSFPVIDSAIEEAERKTPISPRRWSGWLEILH
jgi:tetratricopeptide (TPR) repeat protein